MGESAIDCIALALHGAGRPAASVERILDLPCGHGRVLRYLRGVFPRAEITACDLDRDGVEFCARRFGAIPVVSEKDPERIPIAPESFDLIWVGSLLTHLDAPYWDRFLATFRRFLRPGGVLVFTSHGRGAHERMRTGHAGGVAFSFGIGDRRQARVVADYAGRGFGYAPYPDQDGGYGVSLATPAWVLRRLEAVGELRTVLVSEQRWADFHDVFACVREPGWRGRAPVVTAAGRTTGRLVSLLRALVPWAAGTEPG